MGSIKMGLIKFVEHNTEALTVVNTAFLVSATYQPNRVSLLMMRGELYPQIDRQDNPEIFDRIVNLLFENTLFDSQITDAGDDYFDPPEVLRD